MSTPGTVGDYAASIGTTGFDIITPPDPSPPTGAMTAYRGLSLDNGFSDGTSHTLLVGEKHIPRYLQLTTPYDCNLYSGHNWVCHTRAAGPAFPLASAPDDMRLAFGSEHPGVVLFAFVDGGVRPVRKTVTPFVLGQLAHRNDGLPAPAEY